MNNVFVLHMKHSLIIGRRYKASWQGNVKGEEPDGNPLTQEVLNVILISFVSRLPLANESRANDIQILT